MHTQRSGADEAPPAATSTSAAADVLVEFREVSKTFGATRALKSVSFGIRRGTIHCLLGENGAGKSTVGKILGGVYGADSGTVLIDGAPADIRSVADARAHGIAIVFQELSLAPDLSVRENICLGTESRRGFSFVPRWAEAARCRALLATLDLDVDLEGRTADLPIAQQQLIEIAKALQSKPRLIILDEPTAMLGAIEKRRLFDVVARLKGEGTTFVFVTHHLDEVMAIGDSVTILRDGSLVESFALDGTHDGDAVIEKVSGRRVGAAPPARLDTVGPPMLAIAGLPAANGGTTTIEVRQGEIVGLYGVVGCGREAVIEAAVGVRPSPTLDFTLAGTNYRPRTPAAAARRGVGYLPTGRAANAILPTMSIEENLTISQLRRFARLGFLDRRREAASAREQLTRLKTRMGGVGDLITTLSGGNQQKVMLGRCLARGSNLVVLEDPTAGIDVGAKEEIHGMIRERAAEGLAVLFISSDLRETIALCTTVYTVYDGRIVDSYPAPSPTDEADILSDVLGTLPADRDNEPATASSEVRHATQ